MKPIKLLYGNVDLDNYVSRWRATKVSEDISVTHKTKILIFTVVRTSELASVYNLM
jgi:hypothetical protein